MRNIKRSPCGRRNMIPDINLGPHKGMKSPRNAVRAVSGEQ